MPYINLPPTISEIFWELEKRVGRLETAYRFNAPNINFSTSTPTNPNVGDIYYNTYDLVMQYWNGTEWVVMADDNLGVPVITWYPTWAASTNPMTYTGTPAVGHYSRVGKMITYTIEVTCTTVTDFGTGAYTLTLPSGLLPAYRTSHMGGLIKSATKWSLIAELASGSDTIILAHPTSNGVQDIFSHNKPTVLTTASTFHINGTYFIL